ncbi:ATP-binding protein [Streptomyces sp. NPDC002004]
MADRTPKSASTSLLSGRRHRAHAGDGFQAPPAFTASAVSAVAVASGWGLDGLDIVPPAGGAVAACAAAGGVLWWTAVRSLRARGAAALVGKLREERDDALQALGEMISIVDKGRGYLHWALDQARRGNVSSPVEVQPERSRTGNVRTDAVAALEQWSTEAWQAVLAAAAHTRGELHARAELAEIFQSIAPRLQGLVNRSIHDISEVERTIEDPDLLGEIYRLDHLLTQIRRAVESLAVLGGNLPSRNSDPILIVTAIRRAVAEIPEYARVRVALNPVTTAVPGYVSPNLVHLLAALMENATDFSTGQVEVHTHHTDEGVAIEVVDRGTGLSQRKREALNRLLAAPETEDPRARLRDGQIGLLVAALLAKRHKITIRLRPNIVGGTQAVVVLPRELLVDVPETPRPSLPNNASRGPLPPPTPGVSTTAAGNSHDLPRRIAPAADRTEGPQRAEASRGHKPALPRRDTTQPTVSATTQQQVPSGPPTSGLMAGFSSRTPREGHQPPHAPPI